ncbi:tyrosine-type recombinase/integrase [Chloroflexota bacterium]
MRRKRLSVADLQGEQGLLVTGFLRSRRQGLSSNTIKFYRGYLRSAAEIVRTNTTAQEIDGFLGKLGCSNGGKHAYYRTLRTFFRWLYSPRSGMGLSPSDNPMLLVDPPKVEKKILPTLTVEQVDYLIDQVDYVRDKAIISLFADSGLRLSELASIKPENIDWGERLIKVRCKGNKEGWAVFGRRTESLLRQWLSQYTPNGTIWDLNRGGIIDLMRRLRHTMGLPCNPHTFRRTFATILAKKGMDSLHIMRLGRWESIAMVERYTRSVQFEDSLRLYRQLEAT